MRIEPDIKYQNLPCSYVATGCAYEDYFEKDFFEIIPDGLRNDGYLNLDNANKYIRKHLPVKKKQYFKRSERITLREFLSNNTARCCVCVYGHFIYVNQKDYWSFFENEDDLVVCIWFLK